MLYAMLYIKEAGKTVQIGLHSCPLHWTHPHPCHQTACGTIRLVISITGIFILWSLSIPGLLGVIDVILAMDRQKPQLPNSGLALTH